MSRKGNPTKSRRDGAVDALRHRIMDRYVQGWTLRRIGEDPEVRRDVSAVSRHVQAVLEEWRAQDISDMGALKVRELAKLDRLEATLWEAWERSREDAVVKLAEKLVRPPGAGPGAAEATERARVSERREGQVGDPQFLSEVRACVELRAKILGFLVKRLEPSEVMKDALEKYVAPRDLRRLEAAAAKMGVDREALVRAYLGAGEATLVVEGDRS